MPAGVSLLTCFPSLTNKGFCHFSLVNHSTPVPIIYFFFQGVPWEAGILEHPSLPLFLVFLYNNPRFSGWRQQWTPVSHYPILDFTVWFLTFRGESIPLSQLEHLKPPFFPET